MGSESSSKIVRALLRACEIQGQIRGAVARGSAGERPFARVWKLSSDSSRNVVQQAPHVAPATGTGKKGPAQPKRCDTARTFAKKGATSSARAARKLRFWHLWGATIGSGHGKAWHAGQHGCYAAPVRRAGPAALDEERVRRAFAITSAIESFQIFAAARVSAGKAWL
jgi:hypothetical protein